MSQFSQYIMQASPLTRIRLPEWHLKCLNDPSLLMSDEPFTVVIPRTLGAVRLVHKKVTLASSLIPRIRNRMAEEDEISPLVNWLTSPHEVETDIWGVVALKVDNDIADQIISLVLSQGTNQKVAKTVQELQQNLVKSFKASQEEADARVTRALSRLYNVVKVTRDHMKKNNLGVYSASHAEALAIYAITDTVKHREIPDFQANAIIQKAFDVAGLENMGINSAGVGGAATNG